MSGVNGAWGGRRAQRLSPTISVTKAKHLKNFHKTCVGLTTGCSGLLHTRQTRVTRRTSERLLVLYVTACHRLSSFVFTSNLTEIRDDQASVTCPLTIIITSSADVAWARASRSGANYYYYFFINAASPKKVTLTTQLT